MSPDSNSSSPSIPPSSSKRSRDPEDEVYIDNLHSHKRYLSEIMASSLNGLTVGDTLPENLMESPARSDSMWYLRDEMPLQYSPMSEDSDDSRFYEAPTATCSSQSDSFTTSPVSPYRHQRPLSTFCHASSTNPMHGPSVTPAGCSQPRQQSSDSEGRFPSSPSDICHSADLRRTALLRSVHLRTQPSGAPPFECSGQEPLQNIEVDERPCSPVKSLVDDRGNEQTEECTSSMFPEPEFTQDKSSLELNRSAGENELLEVCDQNCNCPGVHSYINGSRCWQKIWNYKQCRRMFES